MILPKSLLAQVSYYKTETINPFFSENLYDVITVYFKPWWKPRKKFKFKKRVDSIEGYVSTLKPSDEFLELSDQLRKYCQIQ